MTEPRRSTRARAREEAGPPAPETPSEPASETREKAAKAPKSLKRKRASVAVNESTPGTPVGETAAGPRQTLPLKVVDGQPLPTLAGPQPLELLSAEWQTIQQSGVLSASLQRSRAVWVSGVNFRTFHKKHTMPKKLTDRTDADKVARARQKEIEKNFPPVGVMDAQLVIEPHTFPIKLYAPKEGTRAVPKKMAPPQYGAWPNHSQHAQHPPQYQQYAHPPKLPQPYPPKPPQPRPPPKPVQQPPQTAPGPASTPAPDPVIHMLAARAGTDPELKAVMKIVAAGQASKEQLEFFQTHINELTEILDKQKKAGARQSPAHPAHPAQPPTRHTPAQPAQPPTRHTPAQPAQPSTQHTPAQTPAQPPVQPPAQPPAQPAQPAQPAPTPPPPKQPSAPSPAPLKQQPTPTPPPPRPAPPQQQSLPPTPKPYSPAPPQQRPPQPRPPPNAYPVKHYNQPPYYQQPPPHYPAQPPRITYRPLTFEFVEGNGDRFYFPSYSFMEWLPNGSGAKFSFLVTKLNPKSEETKPPETPAAPATPATPAPQTSTPAAAPNTTPTTNPPFPPTPSGPTATPTPAPTPSYVAPPRIEDFDERNDLKHVDFYQPVTVLVLTDEHEVKNALPRAIRPPSVVEKYMEDVFDTCKRAEETYLAFRLPKEGGMDADAGARSGDVTPSVSTPIADVTMGGMGAGEKRKSLAGRSRKSVAV